MKRFKVLITLIMAAVLVLSITACSKKETSEYDSEKAKYNISKADEASYGYATGSSSMQDNGDMVQAAPQEAPASAVEEKGAIANTSTVSSGVPDAGTMEKIIRRIEMQIETQDFDELISAVNDEIKRLEGYVETSNISGKRYHNVNVLRRGYIIARIPKSQLDEFVGIVSEASNVVNKSEATENVTLQYVDAESHIKALKIEQEKLYELLGKTGTLEDILTLESRLSTIRYELENYESQLRMYDNKVEYSTVTLNIEEVERMTPKEEVKDTVFTRIKTGFSDTMYNISEGFKDIVVGFAVNIPYILFWLVVVLIGLILIRRSYKKHKNRKQSGKAGNTSEPMNPNNQDVDQNHLQ